MDVLAGEREKSLALVQPLLVPQGPIVPLIDGPDVQAVLPEGWGCTGGQFLQFYLKSYDRLSVIARSEAAPAVDGFAALQMVMESRRGNPFSAGGAIGTDNVTGNTDCHVGALRLLAMTLWRLMLF